MSYASVGGIRNKFGAANVAMWSDRDNDEDPTKIAAMQAAACTYADAEVDATLLDTHYRKPFVTAAGATPAVIADIANALAGCWLQDAWGQDKFDETGSPIDSLSWHRTKAKATMEQIKTGVIRLDAI